MPSDVRGDAGEAKSHGLWRWAVGPSRSRSIHASAVLLSVPVLLVVGFLALPLLAIFLKVLTQAELWKTLQQPLVTQALWLSLITSCSSLLLAVLCGTPVAYLLARHRFRSAVFLDTLIDLPMVLPPTVAGVALLMTFGRRGLFGPWLDALGVQIGFTTVAVVLAQSFVSPPFYIRAAQAGFRSVDQELERVAYTLGHSVVRTFLRVTVPLAFPALLSGAVMAWARAPANSPDPTITALRDGVVDVYISYCTSAQLRLRQLPTLHIVDIPEALRVGPEYGLALLKEAQPAATGLMLYILSVDGQATLEKFGFRPVGVPSTSAP